MRRYKDLGGPSGVTLYESGDDYINLRFKDGKTYRYDSFKPGIVHVEKMKELAQAGAGLATYVNQNVRENYARRLS